MPLTDQQSNFLNHPPNKSARVLAGPGTGKSFTSVAYLQKVTADDPNLRVGYITFTRAATAEFAKKVGDEGLAVAPKTMHGFALEQLIKNHASDIPYPLRILDSWETKNIARLDISARLKANGHNDATPSFVGKLEQELAAGFESLDQARLPIAEANPSLVNAYKGIWKTHRRQYGYVLLNELPYHAAQVLEDIDESDLGIDLLIVDEYQDLNNAEQKVLIQIAERNIPIVAVGDDDQSIYSWRKAAPIGIRNFLTTFSTDRDYPLTVSMRCGGDALEVASNLIELDSNRQAKPRLSPSERAVETEFHYLKFKSNIGEAKCVARIVSSRINDGVAPNDIAILVRSSTAAWLRSIKPEFDTLGIPIAETGDAGEIISRPSTRKAIALAQLALNKKDSIAWRALIKVTPGIGPTFVNRVLNAGHEGNFAEQLASCYLEGFSPGAGSQTATVLIGEVTEWLENTDLESVELEENGWSEWLIQQVGETHFTVEEKTLLRAVGAQIGDTESLARFISDIEPMAKEIISNSAEGVRVMSMAQSKGLTVNTAIVMGVEDGNIPAPRGETNEELRLLYVAITRATHMTVVTYANRRRGPTARVGETNVWVQQEQSAFMRDLSGISIQDGDSFLVN
jgi:DNA helicase-2/ATP-dependent DNA helicase PcrA